MKSSALFILSILCVSSDAASSKSLVGAKHLPPATVMSREIIEIDRAIYEPGPSLGISLYPNNDLTFVLTDIGKPEIKGKQTFKLSAALATSVRRQLWRLRPERLGPRNELVSSYPSGCGESLAMNALDGPQVHVGFIHDGPNPSWEDDRIAEFLLFRSCKTPEASKARKLVRSVLASFPTSHLTADYDRRVDRVKRELSKPQSERPSSRRSTVIL